MRVRPDDRGFTLVEISITAVMAAVISAAVLSVLVSQSNAERRVQAVAANQEVLRQALVEVERDVRAADPLLPLSSINDYRTQIRVAIRDDLTTDTVRYVQWRLDTAQSMLVREELNADMTVRATTYRVSGVGGGQVFTYYRSSGVAYLLDPVVETAGTVADCAVRVKIRVQAAPNPGPQPLAVETDVQLRNRVPRLPEAPWCA